MFLCFIEFQPELEIPAETCEGGLGTARPITNIASQYINADKPEVTTSFPIQYTQTVPIHNLNQQNQNHTSTNLLQVFLQRFICLVKVIIDNNMIIYTWLFSYKSTTICH